MKKIFIYYFLLIIAWVGAWVFYEQAGLESLSSVGEVVYWTITKFLIWILPVLLVIKLYLKQGIIEYLSLYKFSAGVRTGLVFGLIFTGLSFLLDIFMRGFGWPSISYGLLSALIVAPLFEEVVFRGFILGTLQKSGKKFWQSNLITAVMFLGLHLPGWYFIGSLNTQGIVAVNIVIIGLVAGYAKKKSGSTWASILFHFLNNLYSSFIK